MAKSTVIVFSEAAESVATKFVDAAVSSAVVTSFTEMVGAGSLSVIVMVPVATAIVAFDAFDKLISNVSSISSTASSLIVAEMVFDVCPAVKVSVVEPIAVKSEEQSHAVPAEET